MATPTKTEEKISSLLINYCDTQETLDALINEGMMNEDELYFFPNTIPSAANNVALLGVDGRILDSGKQLTLSGLGAAAEDHTHTTTDIISGTFSTARIPTITSAKLGASAVITSKIADKAVTSEKIGNAAVTTEKIASVAVTNAKIASGAVDTAEIADNAITFAKLSTAFYTTWTPVMSGASSYTLQAGQCIKINNFVILSFQIYGSFSGSTTASITITGAPYTPANSHVAGGGHLSGYTVSAATDVFTGWEMGINGKIGAVGQHAAGTAGGNKWGDASIYQKASGDFAASGTLMFKTS